jgi:Terminase large subunit, T4likevirus-type, N-terminal
MPTIKPQPGPQTAFLAATTDLVFYGGAAGGGKSYALLLDPLRYLLTVPGFHGVIFRRTSPEITNSGGLWDTSIELYSQISGAVSRAGNTLDWTFPPHGNRISFHHLQHPPNVHSWQGSQVTYFGWDEITHFLQRMFEYVTFSRGRSACEIPAYSRCSCNPDPGWVKTTYLAPWVDKEFAGERASPGEVRCFTRGDNDELVWVPRGTPDAQSITFIPSRVTDNQIMLKRNPGYIAKLMAMPRVDRERLLYGNWDVRQEGLVYPEAFDPQYDVMVEHEGPRSYALTDGGMDFGLRAPFCAEYGYIDHDDVMWFTGERYVSGVTIPVHSNAIPEHLEWYADPAGAQEIAQLRQAGHSIRACVHIPTTGASGEKKSPLRSGIDMVRDRMRTGRLKIVRSKCPNLVRELGLYIYDPEKPGLEEPVDADNHATDAMRYRVAGHDRRKGGYAGRTPPRPAAEPDLENPDDWQ